MRAILFILLLSGLALWPFVALRQRWAVRLWERFRLALIVYALVVLLAAVFALIFRWDDIYG